MKRSRADAIVERARLNAERIEKSVSAYLAPTGTPQDTRTIDRAVARMTPDDVTVLAQTDPDAAARAAERMELIDARAAATAPEYPDITD